MARRLLRRLMWEYLSLSRAERRAVRVLGILIFAGALLRGYLPGLIRTEIPQSTPEVEAFIAFRDSLRQLDFRDGAQGYHFPQADDLAGDFGPDPGTDARYTLFFFDPNTAGAEDLIRLGIPEGTVHTLMNYRQAGGKFRKDSDLLRVYGLREDDYRRLQPYIRIRRSFPQLREEKGSWDRPGNNPEVPNPVPFELNRADSSQLVRINGIGPVFARRIIRYRELLGGFYSPHQLLDVYGLLPGQYVQLSRCTYLDSTALRKMDLNSLDERGLAAHPYLDRYQAGALVSYRQLVGAFKDPDEIQENGLLPDSVFRKIEPYLEVRR